MFNTVDGPNPTLQPESIEEGFLVALASKIETRRPDAYVTGMTPTSGTMPYTYNARRNDDVAPCGPFFYRPEPGGSGRPWTSGEWGVCF